MAALESPLIWTSIMGLIAAHVMANLSAVLTIIFILCVLWREVNDATSVYSDSNMSQPDGRL